MSDGQQVEQPQERYGSRFAEMFGYVTPEDRSKWEQARAREKKKPKALKQGAKAGMGSMMEFGERNLNSKLSAAHRVAAQEEFEESHNRVVTTRRDPRTRSIIEAVDWQERDDRTEIEPDLEM